MVKSLITENLLSLLSDSTVVVPSVTYANVPQLAADLLIINLDAKKVARLEDKFLYPFVSTEDPVYSPEAKIEAGVCTALEVFYSSKHKVTIIHQRSPMLPGYEINHINVLQEFLGSFKSREVVLLGSQMRSPLGPEGASVVSYDDLTNKYLKTLYDSINDSKKEVFMTNVYEGDNLQDSVEFYGAITRKLGVTTEAKISTPYSWAGLYGDKPIPVGIEEGVF